MTARTTFASIADRVLPIATTVAMLAALWCVFVYVPKDFMV
jgi:hypothetical protein